MLTDKEKKLLVRYEEDISIPKWKYILIYGVLSFGIIMAVATAISDLIFKDDRSTEIVGIRILRYLLTGMISGFFYGIVMHWLMKKQYHKLKAKETTL